MSVYDSSGALVSGAEDDDSGAGLNASLTFEPDDSDTYYIVVGESGGNDVGTYTVSIEEAN